MNPSSIGDEDHVSPFIAHLQRELSSLPLDNQLKEVNKSILIHFLFFFETPS